MALDASVLCALKNEFLQKLIGARVEKVYQPERDETVISIRNFKDNYKLLLCAHPSFARVGLISAAKDNPDTPPLFCMLLRKHLCGGRIVGIRQVDFERIIEFDVESFSELGDLSVKTLICEIMGKHSNIILTDSERKIIDSIFHVDITMSRVRQILPGLTYESVPPQGKKNPLEAGYNEFLEETEKIAGHYDKKIMSSFMGISPLTAREIAYRAVGSDDEINYENNKKVADEFFKFFKKIEKGEFSPVVLTDAKSGKMLEFSAVDIKQYGTLANTEHFESMSEAIEYFYEKKAAKESVKQRTADIAKVVSNNLARCRKKLQIQCETLEKCKKRERSKICGDLITANIYRIKKGDKKAVLENFYDGGKLMEISLDETLTPAQNAQKYYKKYNKDKTAEEQTIVQKKINEEEIDYLETVLLNMENVETKEEIAEIREELTEQGYLKKRSIKGKKKAVQAKPMRFLSSDGYEIFVGKNNKQNDYVTLKLARSTDIWLHTKNIHGSHAIIKTNGDDAPERTVFEAAVIAAYYSKGRNGANVEVDYTAVKNVKKPSGAKPGMVIYVNNKTAVVTPDEKLVESLKK